jgi:hypothetical protein
VGIAKRGRRHRLLFNPDHFPGLNSTNHKVTSDPADWQNCISYAAGDPVRYWWPVVGYPGDLPSPYFWPLECPLEETIDAFACAFGTVGFKKSEDGEDGRLEPNIEKIAIYAKSAGSVLEPTHAAIQSPDRNGKWRSKMGVDEDIEHDLSALTGKVYGQIQFFMWRTLHDRRVHRIRLKKNRPPSH